MKIILRFDEEVIKLEVSRRGKKFERKKSRMGKNSI